MLITKPRQPFAASTTALCKKRATVVALSQKLFWHDPDNLADSYEKLPAPGIQYNVVWLNVH